jgi:hypothetical protein
MSSLFLWSRFAGVGVAYLLVAAAVARFHPAALHSPWFVVAAMVCVLGLTAVAEPVVPMKLPAGLRAVRRWELRLHRSLGVATFGRVLRETPLRLLNLDVYRRTGPGDAARLLSKLEAAEVSHLVSAALVLPYMAVVAAGGEWPRLLAVTAAQAAVNLYPVMHLRLTRDRLQRVLRGRRPRDARTVC